MSLAVSSSLVPETADDTTDVVRKMSESTSRLTSFVPPLLVLLTLLVAFWPMFESPALPMDEGTLLVYPELILQGQVPYRDFETFYGPANLWVLSAAFSIFGPDIMVERAVGLLYRVAILLALFGIVRRWGALLATGTMLLAGALLLPLQLPAFAWMGALACGLIALWIASTGETKGRYFFSGLFAGLALLFRPDVGPAIVLAGLVLLGRASWAGRWHCLAGVGAGLVPLAGLTLFAGPVEVFNNLFLFPVVYCNPGRRLPLALADARLLTLLVLHFGACVLNLVAGWVMFRKGKAQPGSWLLLACALFSLGLSFQATQRLDIVHFLFVGFLSIALLPLSVMVLARAGNAPRWLGSPGFALASVVALVIWVTPETARVVPRYFVAAFTIAPSGPFFLSNGDRTFPQRPDLAAQKLFDHLSALSKKGERLFVGPGDLRKTNYNDTFIYHLFPQLVPATYFLEMNPFSANRPGSRLAADVRSADWLVLNRSWDSWQEPNRSTEFGSSAPNEVVRADFEVRGEYGPYVLLGRKSAGQPPG